MRIRSILSAVFLVSSLVVMSAPAANAVTIGDASGSRNVAAASANSCNKAKRAVAVKGKWFTATDRNCALAGNAKGVKTYSWGISKDAAGGSVCLNGRGWQKSGYSTKAYWRSGGCTASNSSFKVTWYKTIANPMVKFKAAVAPVYGVGFQWQ